MTTTDQPASMPLQLSHLLGDLTTAATMLVVECARPLPNGEHRLFVWKEQPLRSPEAATPASSSELPVWKLAPLLVRGTSGVCKDWSPVQGIPPCVNTHAL